MAEIEGPKHKSGHSQEKLSRPYQIRTMGVVMKSVSWKPMIEQGATLEEIIAARPTTEWDEHGGDPIRLFDRAFASLGR